MPAAATLLLAGGITSTAWYYPQCLSYYNLLIGGQRGAVAAGMEATYWWDGLDRDVLDWLHAQTGPDEKIAFGKCGYNPDLLRRWGKLERNIHPHEPGRFRWYVIQARPSSWNAVDVWLLQRSQPAYQKYIRSRGWGPWRLDQPIVMVFPFADARRADDELSKITAMASQ